MYDIWTLPLGEFTLKLIICCVILFAAVVIIAALMTATILTIDILGNFIHNEIKDRLENRKASKEKTLCKTSKESTSN